MRLVCDIIAQLHAESRVEESTVGDSGGCVPDLDDMEVTLGGECDTRDGVVLALEELVGQAVDHAVHEDGVGLGGIDLLAPGTALVVLRGVPERTVSITHEEEHA